MSCILSKNICDYINKTYKTIINYNHICEIIKNSTRAWNVFINKETLKSLKYCLKSNKINYKIEILKQQNLKEAHIYCKINNIPNNIYGILIESYLIKKYNMIRNNNNCGDLKYKNINLEIKTSLGGKNNNKFNYVQIRFNHNCNYMLFAYYLNNSNINLGGNLYVFYLTKQQLKKLVLKYGNYAHGTIKNNGKITENFDETKEYSLRPSYNSKCWNRLLKTAKL